MATTFLAQNLERGKTGHCYTELEGGVRQEDWLARVQGRAHKATVTNPRSLRSWVAFEKQGNKRATSVPCPCMVWLP